MIYGWILTTERLVVKIITLINYQLALIIDSLEFGNELVCTTESFEIFSRLRI